MTNEEFYLKFNFQKMLRIDVRDDDIRRLCGIFDIDQLDALAILERYKQSVQTSSKKLFPERISIERTANTVISFVGDSLTSDRESYFNIIKTVLNQDRNLRFDDASRSGNFTSLVLLDFYQEVIYKKPDIVHILIGNNDIRRNKGRHMKNCTSLNEYEENIKYLLKVLDDEKIKTIVSTPVPFLNTRIEKAFEGTNWYYLDDDYPLYCDAVRRAANESNAMLCDFEAVFIDVDKAVALSEDGLHMSREGYEIMAKTLMPCLVETINTL